MGVLEYFKIERDYLRVRNRADRVLMIGNMIG